MIKWRYNCIQIYETSFSHERLFFRKIMFYVVYTDQSVISLFLPKKQVQIFIKNMIDSQQLLKWLIVQLFLSINDNNCYFT